MPVPEADSMTRPYWEGLRREELWVQRCSPVPDLAVGERRSICHHCLAFDLAWVQVEGKGHIYSWERVWHSVHPALKQRRDPYIAVLVALPHAGNVRYAGELTRRSAASRGHWRVGGEVVFEHHNQAEPPYTLAHWRLVFGGLWLAYTDKSSHDGAAIPRQNC